MTAFYILGNGSIVNNLELKYSLRTLEAFATDVDHVIVAGINPGFLSNKVTFISIPEVEGNKEYRIASKISRAFQELQLTDDVLFLNDDYFFTDTFTAKSYPNYYKGCLSKHDKGGNYGRFTQDTYQFLKSQNLPTKHFDIHVPMIYNPQKFLDLKDFWEASKKAKFGYTAKSIYGNAYQLEGINTVDCKLNKLSGYKDFERIFNTRCVFSCSDMGWLNGVEDWLEYKFPKKSKFEK